MGHIMAKTYRECDYGCGKKANYRFKNGSWCCNKSQNSCPEMKRKNSKLQKGEKSIWYGKKHTIESKEKMKKAHKGKKLSKKTKKKIGRSNKGKNRTEETKRKISLASSNISEETRKKMSNSQKGRRHSKETKKKISQATKGRNKGKSWLEIYDKKKIKEVKRKHKQAIRKYFGNLSLEEKIEIYGRKIIIDQINDRYPFFSKIEEMRYRPNNPDEKEIQVHCKNHLCENSKEKGGWFIPTGTQLSNRIRQLENEDGNGGSYFYCSEKCKTTCILYNLQSDPYKVTELSYTSEEIETWRIQVRKLDNNKCQFCGSTKNIHIHHIIPVKLEPFFALDPVNGICLCEKCHYKIGHPTGTECSTGNLASKIC